MNIPTKKLKNGFELPVYGLGLWGMGGGSWQRDTSNDAANIDAIELALDNGITYIDTAEGYGAGHAEELLGQALKNRDRSKIIISTKVSGANQGYDSVQQSIEASLNRMKLDFIDLYILHTFPKPGIDIRETMKSLDYAVEQGLIKNIGVSNLSINRFNVAQSHTSNKIVCNQVHYNLEIREVEATGVLEQAQKNDVMLVAWRPIQKGNLSEAEIIKVMAEKYNKSTTQIALNWLISQNNVVTISKTGSPKHLKENLGALNWNMEPSDIEVLRNEFPNQQKMSDAVPLDYEADVPV